MGRDLERETLISYLVLRRWFCSFVGLSFLLTLSAGARLGGGGGYHSSSSSSSSSSYRSSSSSGYRSSSSSSYRSSSGGSYSSGEWSGDDTLRIIFVLFLLMCMGGAYVIVDLLGKSVRQQSRSMPSGSPLADVILNLCGTTRENLAAKYGSTLSDQTTSAIRPDACFSWPIFREFVCLLYVQALQEADTGFKTCGHHIEPAAQSILRQRFKNISQVTVGTVLSPQFKREGNAEFFSVIIDSNFWQGDKSYAARAQWVFVRPADQISPKPEVMVRLGCSNCGFSGETPGGICPACSSPINATGNQWKLRRISVISQEIFQWQPSEAGQHVGSLIRHSNCRAQVEAFLTLYPDFNLEAFAAEVQQAFCYLQAAWSEGNLRALRAYETDSLLQVHRFWLDYYQRQGLHNKLEKVTLHAVEISNINRDCFYDAITVRVVASMLDLMLDKTGKLIWGNKSKPVTFAEYWTFIRRTGYQSGQHQYERNTCPSCGGDLSSIRQTGECDHCGSLLTLGNFGWVLSAIEQEEVYKVIYMA